MKRFAVLLLSCCFFITGFSQTEANKAPYERFPEFPPFTLLMQDSSSVLIKEKLPKKSPVLLILFNPDCDHCQHETEDITKRIEEFSKIQIIMATPASIPMMKAFIDKYNLTKFKNIVVGQDHKMMMPTFFMIRNMPFLAFYNEKKELIETFSGSMPVDTILSKFRK